MSEETAAMWREIQSMKQELESLSIKRGVLVKHLEELRTVSTELEESHAKVTQMADEVEKHLEGGTDGTS